MSALTYGQKACGCERREHEPRFVAVTGGPGGGKTAILSLATRSFCEHVAILPEAATIVFGGGFPRHDSLPGRAAAQRAIFHVQRAQERLVFEERKVAVALCDRGTPDGAAYWPGDLASYWAEFGTSAAAELGRYDTVIHLQSADARNYEQDNPLRPESPELAATIDDRIRQCWEGHSHRVLIPRTASFTDKARVALEAVRCALPRCCHAHGLAAP